MKRLLWLLAILPAITFADVKISALPAGSTLTGVEVVPAVQSATTVGITANQIKTSANVPGGSSNQVQVNSAGAFGGITNGTAGTVLSATAGAPAFVNTAAAVTALAATPNTTSLTPNCTYDINTDSTNVVAGTFTVNAPGTCTAVNGQRLQLWISATNAQTYSWNAIYAGGTNLALPTSTSSGALWDYLQFQYNVNTAKWVLTAYLPANAAPLSVGNGGTGDTTLTAHGVLLGEGTSNIVAITPAADSVVLYQTATADPIASALTSCSTATSALTYYTREEPIEAIARRTHMRLRQFQAVLRRARWRIGGFLSALELAA